MTKIKLAVIAASLLTLTGMAADKTFLDPPQHAGPPLTCHAVTNRAFQGISSMAVTPGGRLWAVWYAGVTPGEDHNNYVTVTTSGDGGRTWKEVLIVDPDGKGPIRTFDPELWMAPDGRLRLVWAQSIGHRCTIAGVWMMTANEPENEQADWQAPQRITDGVMMCKPIVLSSGEWVLPASTWKETDFSAKMVVSTDRGKSWSIRGACNIPDKDQTFDEHMIVERKDGSLWLLARTNYGIGESFSSDRGKTWTEMKPSAISHPPARFFINRLNSGSLLLVKHGPIDKKIGRSHLTAYISKDDGKSWEGGFMLDERGGVSYPDGQQTADGTIYITYDYNRTTDRNIFFATFKEEDVAAGKAVSDSVRLRQVISKASGGRPKKDMGKPKPVKNNSDGVALDMAHPGRWENSSSTELKVGTKLFSDRGYTLSENRAPLEGIKYILVKMDGKKTLKCKQSGMLYFCLFR